jgi:glycosyltransferase involved in cell wall biosynthesis
MHILFIHHHAGAPYQGHSDRVYYLAQEWMKDGHTISVITSTQSHVRVKTSEYTEKVTEEFISGIKYIWIKTRSYNKNGIGRILNILEFLKGVYFLIPELKKEKPDAVIAASTYLLDAFPAYKIARQAHAKFIYEVRDLWPLSPMEIGGYSEYHPYIMLLRFAEKFVYTHVDVLITVLPCSKQYMVIHGLNSEKFRYIPNGISLNELNDSESLDDSVKRIIPDNKFIVGFTGQFGIANSLSTLFEAASIIQFENPEIYFVIIGNGPEKDNLINLQNRLALKNLIIINTIPKKQVQSVLSLFDICIITWNKQSVSQYGVSFNKLFDYMYSGKPVIWAVNTGHDIVNDAHCGFTVEPENPDLLAEGIIKLYKMSKEDRQLLGKNGYSYVIQNHNYEILAKQFLKTLSDT